jgi:pimeloyl-ACP methyl ester carboxylesterase
VLAALVSLALIASACSSSTSSTPTTAPHGLPSFYVVPSGVASQAPGTLLKSEKVTVPGVVGASAYRVMYVSTGIDSKHVAVTGMVYVPLAAGPSGGYDVVTWSHGTNGMADICAPSTQPSNELLTTMPMSSLNKLVAKDWVVTASDYQGEGTPPGLLPYLVGGISAQNSIDIVLAAHQLTAAHTSKRYEAWGHSEGGQTAMFAWQMGTSYGTKEGFTQVATVAGAPPTQFSSIYTFLETSPYRFYLYMATVGFHTAYGDTVPLSQILTPTGLKLLPTLEKGCYNYLQSALDKYSYSQLFKQNPTQLASFAPLLSANDPGKFTSVPATPLLIIQGGNDQEIPVVTTQLLYTNLCALGASVQRWIYPGESHYDVMRPSASDMVQWMADRFAGVPVPGTYQPTGVAGVQTQSCVATG